MTGQVRQRRLSRLVLIASGLTLLLTLAVTVYNGTAVHSLGNVVALKMAMSDPGAAQMVTSADDYMGGQAAYALREFRQAAAHFRAAVPSHGTFARYWLALSLEQQAKPDEGRQVLDLDNNAELSLYGDILLREWTAAPAADKQKYLAWLQAQQPAWILPFANRLIEKQHLPDAAVWAKAAPNFSTSPDALVTLGNALYMQNQVTEATELFRRAYSLRPDAIAAYWYGTALSQGDDPERGAALLEEATQAVAPDTPLLPWMLRMVAVGHSRSGRCVEAAAAFDRAAASDPSAENQARVAEVRDQYQEQCQYEAAWRAYTAGDYAQAATLFEAVLPTYGKVAQRQLALSLSQLGRVDEAIAKVDFTNDEDLSLYGNILMQHWSQFSTEQKAGYLARLQAQRPDLIAPLAQSLIDQQQYADAAAWAKAVPNYTTSPEALLVLGQVAYQQADLATASNWFSQAYALRQDTLTGYWYGRTLAFGPEPDRGTAVLEQTVANTPAGAPLLPWILRDLAVGHSRSGRCAEAAAALDRAAASDPSAENQARVAEVRDQYQEQCQYEAAWRAYTAGDYAQAATLFEAVLPTYGKVAQRQLALSLSQLGRVDEAIAKVDFTNDEDLSLYGNILMQHWSQFSTEQKAGYLARLQAQRPDLIAPLAQSLIDQQQYADAAAWAKAVPNYTTSPEALLVLGQVAYQQADLATASNWFSQAYALRQDTLTGYWYGRTLAFGPEPDRGTAVLEQTVANTPAGAPLLPWILRDLAVGHSRSGRCAEAAAALDRAAASDPSAENQARVEAASKEYGDTCISR